jgi:hypothetical protein
MMKDNLIYEVLRMILVLVVCMYFSCLLLSVKLLFLPGSESSTN